MMPHGARHLPESPEGDLARPHRAGRSPQCGPHEIVQSSLYLDTFVVPVGADGFGGRNGRGGSTGVGDDDGVPTLGGYLCGDRLGPLKLLGENAGRNRSVTVAITLPGQALGYLETDHDSREARGPREFAPAAPSGRLEPEGVDYRSQTTFEAASDDLFEQAEGVGRGVLIVLAAADNGAQGVRRNDLGRPVSGRGPSRLAAPGGSHKDEQRRLRDGWLHRSIITRRLGRPGRVVLCGKSRRRRCRQGAAAQTRRHSPHVFTT